MDKIKGMIIGAALGDALGAPHEFSSKFKYSGKLEYPTLYRQHELDIGQITDDTEMTITLLRTIINDGCYNTENVIANYIKWANSGGWMMGINTRKLFKVKKYTSATTDSQSNGSLMRCSPLALLGDNNCVILDCQLSNPNPINEDCSLIYVAALRMALKGIDKNEIYDKVKLMAKTEEVKKVLTQAANKDYRNIKYQRGWVLHGIYCAFLCLLYYDYKTGMKWVINHPESDTDTNACIAGALLGAYYGWDKLNESMGENIKVVIGRKTNSGKTPRGEEYGLGNFEELCEGAYELYRKFN